MPCSVLDEPMFTAAQILWILVSQMRDDIRNPRLTTYFSIHLAKYQIERDQPRY